MGFLALASDEFQVWQRTILNFRPQVTARQTLWGGWADSCALIAGACAFSAQQQYSLGSSSTITVRCPDRIMRLMLHQPRCPSSILRLTGSHACTDACCACSRR